MFVASTLRPFALSNRAYLARLAPPSHRVMAWLVVGVGAYGQIHDSFVPPVTPWSDLHLGFGALLLCTVGLRLRAAARRAAANPAVDFAAATGHLARSVCLLLYALAALRQVAHISVYVGHAGTFDLGWVVIGDRGGGDQPFLSTMDSFRVYVSYGIAAVVLIRAGASAARARADGQRSVIRAARGTRPASRASA